MTGVIFFLGPGSVKLQILSFFIFFQVQKRFFLC